MSKQRLFTPVSNGSYSGSESSISKRKQDKLFNGRCHCGLDATLLQSRTSMNPGRWFVRCPQWKTSNCNYFVWKDEIEGQWNGFRKALSERKTREDGEKVNDEVKMLMKIGKGEAEVVRLKVWVITIFSLMVLSFVCNVYMAMRM